MLHRAGSSFLKIGVTFAVLIMLGNIGVSREILGNNEMGLLSSFFNCFKNVVEMLAGSNAFLACSELIIIIIDLLGNCCKVIIKFTGNDGWVSYVSTIYLNGIDIVF